MKIRFERHFKIKRPEMNNRRLSAARRALQRKNDKVALFPEMQDPITPEERVQKSLDGIDESVKKLRAKVCLEWRACRAMLRTMPSEGRNKFLGYWNSSGFPGTAECCLSRLKQWQAGRINLDEIIADLRRVRRIGFNLLGHDPNWMWKPLGDPAKDHQDPRLINAYREGAD